ncbi:MAG: GDP-mannose 4,6-dehydratase, partial [Terriglobia bacterium]
VRYLLEVAFGHAGMDYRDYVEMDPSLLRPAEVNHLRGDYSLANHEMGWKPKVSFEDLVKMMVDADVDRLKRGQESLSLAHIAL